MRAPPSPTKEFTSNYKKAIMQFLWSNTPPKIAYNRLVQPYTKLGLKLTDFTAKDSNQGSLAH